MATKKNNETRRVSNQGKTGDFNASPAQSKHSSLEVDDELIREGADVNIGGGKKLGGPTGGDFEGGGRGPALGARHASDDSTADHYGSREETNAALEERIAIQNTRRLHGHY
jgi:hypothetical protein